MLYIISLVKNEHGNIMRYKVFDALSHSLLGLEKKEFMQIISNTEMKVVNASIQNNSITIKNWINGLSTEKYAKSNEFGETQSGPKIVILAKEHDRYKTVRYTGEVQYREIEELKELVESGMVANCNIENVGGELTIEDAYSIQLDRKFEELIRSKYDKFIAKTTMLGREGMTFDYEIENYEVKLTKYTGINTDIIIPSFVTIIGKEAFGLKGTMKVNLNEGLKVIGSGAFMAVRVGASLDRVEIPSTVKLIEAGAFYGNSKLFDKNGGINTDRIKLRNSKTIVLGQYKPRE